MICGQSTCPNRARLRPQSRCDGERIETELVPPFRFIATAVDLPMVSTAERHRELIAHLAAERPGLGESKMMGIRRLPATDETGLRGDELEMSLVSVTPHFADYQDAFVDA